MFYCVCTTVRDVGEPGSLGLDAVVDLPPCVYKGARLICTHNTICRTPILISILHIQ